MNDQDFGGLRQWWLFLLLLMVPLMGLRAQCVGPFDLACITEVNLTLNDTCKGIVTYDMVVTGLPTCLGAENFTIVVEDGATDNGATVDGPGRFRYTVVGKDNPDLTDFTCWGYVTTKDITPPVIEPFATNPINLACGTWEGMDVNELPAEISNCYRVDGGSGAIIPGSLAPELRAILESNAALPLVTDACGGEIEVCVNDDFSAPVGTECNDTVRLVRYFTATQLTNGADVAPAISAQEILFLRPQIDQLVGVEEAIFISCEDFSGGLNNPQPLSTDFPYFNTSDGPIHLDLGYCMYQVVVMDGERIETCGDNFTFVRTFQLVDWCLEIDTSFVQVVRVGDMEGPVISAPTQDNDFDGVVDQGPLRFPTNTAECSAILNTRNGGVAINDECESPSNLVAYVYLEGRLENYPLGPYQVFSDNIQEALTAPIPVGSHLLRYIGEDACGNTSGIDVNFEVYDATEPTMRCEDGLNVNLDGSGLAVLAASVFDAGSSDACSPIGLEVALLDANDGLLTLLDDKVVFTCENLGSARVLLEGTDAVGNKNRCWLNILVEDKTAPVCIPPPDVTITCTAFSEQFSQDLVWQYVADPFGVQEQLNNFFGEVTATDNCPNARTVQSINGELNNCGVGQFTRYFRAVDATGSVANNQCHQIINVTAENDYSIRFPGDESYECGEIPDPEAILGTENGCDLLVVTTDVDTLVAEAAECYKLRLTYDVINWCEYNSLSEVILVPRDPDSDGNFAEPVYLHIVPREGINLEDDRAILDQDATPFNGTDFGDLIPNYGTANRRGFFRYQQYVKVYDEVAPELTVPEPDIGLAITQDCLGGVILEFTATDACSAETSTTIFIDTDVADRNNDGQFTAVDFVADREINQNRFMGDPETGVEVFIRNLPIGRHLARVRTTDGCGNQDQRFVVLTVEDGKAPTPSCIQSISTALMPDPETGGIGVVWANDFVASPASVCTETPITYSIYTEEEARMPGFIPKADNTRLDLDCGDLGEIILRIYAFAESTGRHDFCNAVLHVTDNSGNVCADRTASIAGVIRTETGAPMADIAVYNDGPVTLQEQTQNDGGFLFDGLEESFDYTIQPYDNSDPLNGVATRDINFVARYLLGVDDDLTPYQLIAADANRNGVITIRDLIMIREVILGLADDFDNNTSWRFIPKDYVFPDPEDPFAEDFPEVANFNDLSESEFVEFVAIKTGDLDNSARPTVDNANRGGVAPSDDRIDQASSLSLRQDPNKTNSWRLVLAEGADVSALQFSLDLPEKAAVTAGLISAEEFRRGLDGKLHVSYAPLQNSPLAVNQALLTFTLPAQATIAAISLSDDALPAEAYSLRNAPIRLQLTDGQDSPFVSLAASVTPNPLKTEARLRLQWPITEEATLSIRDLSGRLISERRFELQRGSNQIELSEADFAPAAGVYLLRVSGDSGEYQRSLRVIKQ